MRGGKGKEGKEEEEEHIYKPNAYNVIRLSLEEMWLIYVDITSSIFKIPELPKPSKRCLEVNL